MATKLQTLRSSFSIGNLIKQKGTGADFAQVMKPTSKDDITPYSREKTYRGTEEFDQQFKIEDKVYYSDNEVKGAKMIAEQATEAAKNKEQVVKSQVTIDKAKTQWYEADQELMRGQSTESLKRFDEKLKTQTLLDSQAPEYMRLVGGYARENTGAVAVMAKLDQIETSMKL